MVVGFGLVSSRRHQPPLSSRHETTPTSMSMMVHPSLFCVCGMLLLVRVMLYRVVCRPGGSKKCGAWRNALRQCALKVRICGRYLFERLFVQIGRKSRA